MCNFTKGEWVLHRVNHDMTIDGEVHVVASEGYPSAFVPSWIDDEEAAIEAMANAHLIAAAPEMYEMLEKILAEYKAIMLGESSAVSDIEQLLAKARGEHV
ncbi:hypothetical protein ValSw33_56 [Vibrio phage ValSw3-3]|nr:hypothetical protein ValSw33_56 [Vibrio phage ValSw3-3]